MLLWFGDEAKAPACPANAPSVGYEGHTGPIPPTCGACSCTSSAPTCGLPANISASAAPCDAGADGGSPAPFDGPAGWDGGCTTFDAIDAGVASLTTTPLVVNESGCTPEQPPPGNGPGLWTTFVRDCTASAGGTCASPGETCSPTASAGFHQCIFFLAEGAVTCPIASFSAYTEAHVFYASGEDTRQCSPCACTSTLGTCLATLSIYADSTCAGTAHDIDLTSTMPLSCSDVPSATPSALGSKSIRIATSTPGICQASGGQPMGMVLPLMPSTFCCLPP